MSLNLCMEDYPCAYTFVAPTCTSPEHASSQAGPAPSSVKPLRINPSLSLQVAKSCSFRLCFQLEETIHPPLPNLTVNVQYK